MNKLRRGTLHTEPMQDGWVVETKIRLRGKGRGQTYKVFRAPDGTAYYTVSAALKKGFKGFLDGTCPVPKAKAKSKAKAKTEPKKAPGKKPGGE